MRAQVLNSLGMNMGQQPHRIYEFSRFQLDVAQRVLLQDGGLVALPSRALDVLLYLIQNRGRVLEKEEIMKGVWPDTFVEEGNLTHYIFVLRKALGDDQNGNCIIQTIPKRGYRFVAAVKEVASGSNGAHNIQKTEDRALPATAYWTQNSPFRSLRPFEAEDSCLFFGRESETEDLLARLSRSPVLVVLGNSGSGKSSLIRAGLIPALQQGHFRSHPSPVNSWRTVLFCPSGTPFDYLADVLPNSLTPELNLQKQSDFITHCREKLPSRETALRDAIGAITNSVSVQSRPSHVLLVADQFEEIFTLTENRKTRDRYIDSLLAANSLNGPVAVYLVLILRADFYANCLEHQGLSRLLETNLYNVPRMSADQLHQSIEKRLAMAGGQAEAGFIDSLLAEVGDEPGDLALLEHALGLLWEKCGGAGCTLTSKAYSEIGRLRGALSRHADEVYDSMPNEIHKELTRKIFLELIHLGEGAQDTRRRLRKTDMLSLGSPQEIEFVLAHLVSSRLISAGAEGQQAFIEISHEALLREWPALQEWIAQNREELRLARRLMQAAEEWQKSNHDPGAILQGTRLSQAEEWLARHAEAPFLVRQFVQAGIEERDNALRREREAQELELSRQSQLREEADARAAAEKKLREQQESAALQMRRLATHLRRLVSALAVLLLVAVGVAWFAYHAYHQGLIERSNALAAQSSELLNRDHGRALEMALRRFSVIKTDETRLALAKALPETIATLKHERPVERAVFSPDGHYILTASYDHMARIWNSSDGRLITTLQGHSDKVEHAAFSPDGRYIVTASWDHTARIWSSTDGRLLTTLEGHTDAVLRATFSPDGQRIVTASRDHTARIWSIQGKQLAVLQHDNVVPHAEFSPDGRRIVTASWDHTARIWNTADGQLMATLRGHSAELMDSEFSPDGQRIITTSRDQTARVWNSSDGRLTAILHHQGPVLMARFSADGQRIVSASEDGTAQVWASATGQLLAKLPHDGPLQYAEFSPDGRHIITASFDRMARLWDSANGHLLAIFQGHTDQVMHAAFSADGQNIVTASADGTARLWKIASGRLLSSLQGHTDRIYRTAVSPDGQRIVTASADGTARVWNAASGKLQFILGGHSDRVSQVAVSVNGQLIVTASVDNTARVWRSTDGSLVAILKGHTGEVWDARCSPDGRSIVTASSDKTARIWNVTDGKLLSVLQGHTGPVWSARFSPDGKRVVTAGTDGTARVWSAMDGHLLATLQANSSEVLHAEFSPDGQLIVTASKDHTARVWNSMDGHLLATLMGHGSEVLDAEFSPDGRMIVTAGADTTARVWRTSDAKLLAILQGHTSGIRYAKFSPDGRRIVTASSDATARVWEGSNGNLLAMLQGHTDAVSDVAFSPDGQKIVTASWDHTARVWDVITLSDVEKLLAK